MLNGANRAATEGYLLELARAVSGERPHLRLFHPSAVSQDDPYYNAAQVRWPTNLLFAATLTEGAATLPVSAGVWTRGVYLSAHLEAGRRRDAVPPRQPTEISPDVPPTQGDLRAHDGIAEELISAAYSGLPVGAADEIRGAVSDPIRRLARGLAAITSDSKAVTSDLISACVVPAIAAIAGEAERGECVKAVAEALGPDGARFAQSVAAARRSIG